MYIPASKIIALCAVVVIACSALLFVTTILDERQKSEPQKIAEIEKQQRIAQDEMGGKKESAKDNAEQMRSTSKNEMNTKTAPQKTTTKSNTSSGVTAPSSTQHSSVLSNASKKTQTDSARSPESQKSANITSEKQDAQGKDKIEGISTKENASAPPLQKEKNEVALKPVEKKPLPEKPLAPKQAADIPEIPLARPGAKLIVIFDDGGQNLQQLEKCLALPFPVTIAVLPKLSHSKAAADKTRAAGKDVMLHQPMQAIARADGTVPNPGEGAITPEMSLYEIERTVRENIAEIGPVVGLNNHEGSAICEDESRIGEVLKVANDNGVFFLDSRTTSQTRVPQAAMSMGYSYYERNVFLDNTKKRADIIAEIMRGVSIANKTGAAIMIGHVWSADVLPPILAELYPLLRAKGYEFTTVPKSGALITP